MIIKKTTINEIPINYLFEINKETLEFYFKMKQKHGKFFNQSEQQDFIEKTSNHILSFCKENNIESLAYPETTNKIFLTIIETTKIKAFKIQKNKKQDILNFIKTQKMMKDEKSKLIKMIDQMNHIKIGLLAGNQRKRIAPILFENFVPNNKKCLLIDDSVFSGNTLKAIHNEKFADTLILFVQI